MASLVKVNEALGKVVTFAAPLVPLIQCHMVDFLTLRHWDTLLPPQLQQDLLNLPSDILHLLPSASLPHNSDETSQGSDEPWNLSSTDLSSFLWQVRRHCLVNLGVMTPIEQILGEYGTAEISTLAMKGIMSNKKTHEVDVMAQVIARLTKGLGVKWLVDLGSGRGYLSTSLALQYSLNVVAIDSSTTNTSSALVRNAKLKRWWDNLRQTWLDRAEGRPVKKGKKSRKQKTPSSPQQQQEDRKENVSLALKTQENITHEDRKQENLEQDKKQDSSKQEDQRQEDITHQEREGSESLASHHVGHYIGVTKFITEDTDLLEVVRSAIRTEKVTKESRDSDGSEIVNSESDLGSENKTDQYSYSVNTAHTTTKANTTDTRTPPDVEITTDQHSTSFNTTCPTTSTRRHTQDMETSRDHYTSFPATSIDTAYSNTTTSNKGTDAPEPFCMMGDISSLGLVGLHTCGNLASSSLRLFIANAKVAFLCNVGCCYHLLEEEFSQNTYNQQKLPLNEAKTLSINKNEECLSECVEETEVSTVNERKNVESSTGHSEKGDEGDIDPLHPSTIPNLGHGFPLSTFLRDKKFSLGRNSRMLSCQPTDRLTQGNTGSPDPLYWRALLQVVLVDKLGDVSHLSHVGRLSAKCQTFPEYARAALARLEVSLEITEEELQEYDRRYCSHKSRLERFFLLRASLAAVVEGVMLLDRLAYLCEQDGMAAFLVQLFDPVTSPRSHALIAVRMREGSTPSVTVSQGTE